MIKNCCICGLEIWALTIGASYAGFLTTMRDSKVVSTHRTGTHPKQPLPSH